MSEWVVGFVGTGLLGYPMAERLAAEGNEVHAWNRTLEKALPLRDEGVVVSKDASDVFERAPITILMLSDAAAIREVLFERVGTERLAGKTLVQMGTIGPWESRDLAKELRALGAEYVEAPVLGSIPEARAGRLIVMCGSSRDQFERLSPLFEVFGPGPRYVGEVGAAATLKLALNHLIAAHLAAFSQSLGLVRRSGLSIDLFMEVLRNSSLHAKVFDKKLPLLLERDFSNPHFPTKHLLKDLRLFHRAASDAGVATEAASSLVGVLERAVDLGVGDLDYSSLYVAIDPAEE